MKNINIKRIPPLRIAITSNCNMNCKYCPCNGESNTLKNRNLTETEFKTILKKAYDSGFRSFSITGGEPLTVPDLTFSVAKFLKTLPNVNYVKLNTNGILIQKYIKQILGANFDQVKVSLDSFNNITHLNLSSCQYGYIKTVNGIDLLIKNSIPVRLQVVVGKYNVGELDTLLDFCISKKIDLCLFDMLYFENNKSGDNTFWENNYISLNDITESFKKKFENIKKIDSVGGFGHSISEIDTHLGVKIQIRDTKLGSCYSGVCKNCKYYKCTEGLCTLVLSVDGRLKICRNEGFDISLIDDNGKLKSDNDLSEAFRFVIKEFQSSTFQN